MPNAAHVRPWRKMDQKTKISTKQLELSFKHHSICLADIVVLVWSNVKIEKNGRVMPIQNLGKNAFWAENWKFWLHFSRYANQVGSQLDLNSPLGGSPIYAHAHFGGVTATMGINGAAPTPHFIII